MKAFDDLRKHYAGAKSLAALCLCLSYLVSSPVNAQAVPVFDGVTATTSPTGGNVLQFGGAGKKLSTSPTLGGLIFGKTAAYADIPVKSVYVSNVAQMPVGTAGRSVAVTMTGKITGASLAKAGTLLVSMAGGPLGVGVAVALAAAPSLVDWFNSAGFVPTSTGGFQGSDPSVCTVAPCSEFGFQWSASQKFGWSTMGGVAAALAAYRVTDMADGRTCNVTNAASLSYTCYSWSGSKIADYTGILVTRSVLPSSVVLQPVSIADVEAKLQNFQPPAGVLPELYAAEAGGRYNGILFENLPLVNIMASGAAKVAGPATVSETPAQNGQPATKTTDQTDYNCVYVVVDVKCNEVKTSTTQETTTDPATGAQTVKTTTSTATAEPSKPAETVDPCDANPDRLGCSKTDVPTDQVPKSEKTISWAAEELGLGAGTCPAPFTFHTSNGDYALNLAQYCGVLTNYVKPVVICLALLAAFFIVAPVRTGA